MKRAENSEENKKVRKMFFVEKLKNSFWRNIVSLYKAYRKLERILDDWYTIAI